MSSGSSPAPTAVPTPNSSNLALLKRLTALGWRYRGGGFLLVGLNGLLVALTVLGLGLAGLGIDIVRHALQPGTARPVGPLGIPLPESWSPMATVAVVAALIAMLGVLVTLLKYITALVSADLSQRVLIQLRTDVYDKLQRLSFRFFDAAESSSLINRASGDVQAVRTFVDGVFFKVVSVSLSLLVYLVYMLNVHVPLTLVCLATTPLLCIGSAWFSRRIQPQYRRSSELGDQLIQVLSESFQGIHVVKGFAREPEQIARFETASGAVHDQKRRIFWMVSLFQPVMGFLTQFNQFILLGFGGYLVVQGQMALGTGLFVFANLLNEFANQVGQITNIVNTIQSSLTGAERVFEILDAPGELTSPAQPVRLPRARGAIRFENVCFSYQDEMLVLHDLSFQIEPGECVGVAGLTGAGKTTLLSLIPRFYDVQKGQVTIDGHDVRQLHLQDLRRNIGIVFQDSFLFSHTIAANIAFGHPEASMDAIRHAARLAAADEFIEQLPQGYDTIVGEHGSNLSGGQRQRLALARTLLLDPSILLLDDATAAVDAETEHEIQGALSQVLPGRTSLIVSNRLSTLVHTDRIMYLQEGRLVASGTPEELLRWPGPFLEMVQPQLDESALGESKVVLHQRFAHPDSSTVSRLLRTGS
jgi:ATP-binding cassette subfamily B protein